MIQYDKNLHVFSSSLISSVNGFTTKAVGDARETEVKKELIHKVSPETRTVVVPHQTHSTDVIVIGEKDLNSDVTFTDPCDGVVTSQKGVALTIITADCTPILYADDKNKVIAASHQGWKGTLGMLPKLVLNQMVKHGAEMDTITCAIGPTINDCCYEIFGDRLEKFQTLFGEDVLSHRDNRTYLNLIRANYLTLLQAGIKKENINFFPFCTSCDATKFYSNFRDKGIKGEILSYIVQ